MRRACVGGSSHASSIVSRDLLFVVPHSVYSSTSGTVVVVEQPNHLATCATTLRCPMARGSFAGAFGFSGLISAQWAVLKMKSVTSVLWGSLFWPVKFAILFELSEGAPVPDANVRAKRQRRVFRVSLCAGWNIHTVHAKHMPRVKRTVGKEDVGSSNLVCAVVGVGVVGVCGNKRSESTDTSCHLTQKPHVRSLSSLKPNSNRSSITKLEYILGASAKPSNASWQRSK